MDDEPAVRSVARLMLEREGWNVTEAGSLQEAAERIRLQPAPFDLVILDVCLPDGYGTQLAEELRAQPCSPRLLFVTGDPNWLRRLSDRSERILAKPFTPVEMIQAVGSALRAERGAAADNGCA